jgi:hypothetical protein
MVNYHGIWYQHSTVITIIISFYNTEWWYYCGTAVNYCGKKFYNIGPWLSTSRIPQLPLDSGLRVELLDEDNASKGTWANIIIDPGKELGAVFIMLHFLCNL